MQELSKNSIITNYKFVVLQNAGDQPYFHYLKDQTELDRWLGDGSIKSGDVVIPIKEETIMVAKTVNYIELK